MHRFIEQSLCVRQCVTDGQAETFTQFDASGSDRQQTGSARLGSKQIFSNAVQFCSAEMMCHQAGL